MKLQTTVGGEARLMWAYDATNTDKFPIRHFLLLLICRKGVEIEKVYKRLCKERLTQFDHGVFIQDVQKMCRSGWLVQQEQEVKAK